MRRRSRSTWSFRARAPFPATGDTEQLEPGDLALIPPASDHTLANESEDPLAILSVQSPAVSVDETFGRQTSAVSGYEEDDDDY